MYAMASLAVHDALNTIDRRSDFYAHPFRAPGWVSVDAAVAAASHDTLIPGLRAVSGPFVPCMDAAVADVESFYAAKVAAIRTDRPRRPDSTPATRPPRLSFDATLGTKPRRCTARDQRLEDT